MAFTVTARHIGKGNSVQSVTSASTTPTASSLLLIGMVGQRDNHSTAQAFTTSGGSLSYSQIAKSTDVAWASSGLVFAVSAAMHRATVGGSPSAFAMNVDAWATTATGNIDFQACDITGYNTSTPVVQSKANGAQINPAVNNASGTITLDTAPTVGNLLVVYFGVGNDAAGGPASPTAGAGKTFIAISSTSATFTSGWFGYRVVDGTESQTITCADLGETVGAWGGVAVEIANDGPVVVNGRILLETGTDRLLAENNDLLVSEDYVSSVATPFRRVGKRVF